MHYEVIASEPASAITVPALMFLMFITGLGMYWFGRLDERFGILKKAKKHG